MTALKALVSPYLDTAPAVEQMRPKRSPKKISFRWFSHERADELVATVVKRTGVSIESLTSSCRQKEVSVARHIVCWALLENGMGQSEAGRYLGLDHTTVSYGWRKTQERRGEPGLEELLVGLVKEKEESL